jgi:hypothetical protein
MSDTPSIPGNEPVRPAQPTITVRDTTARGWNLTPDQITSMARQLIEAGVDEKTVHEAMAADGIALPPTDKRSDEVKEFDNTVFGEATSPAAYKIAWYERPVEYTDELAAALALHPLDKAGFAPALDRGLRNGLLVLQMPALAGGALIEDGVDGMRAWASMNEVERQLWATQQTYDLHRATGDAASIQLDAKLMIERWHNTNPKLVEALAAAGFFKSAKVQTQLHLQAQRLYHRASLTTPSTSKS